jgi:hypothetical protein
MHSQALRFCAVSFAVCSLLAFLSLALWLAWVNDYLANDGVTVTPGVCLVFEILVWLLAPIGALFCWGWSLRKGGK